MSLSRRCNLYSANRIMKRLLLFSVIVLVIFLIVSSLRLSGSNNIYMGVFSNLYAATINRTAKATASSEQVTTNVNGERTTEYEFMRRRNIVEEICTSRQKDNGSVSRVFTHKSGVIYCAAAKAGCTFWKRVFIFLNNQIVNSSHKNPFEIPRLDVHNFNFSFGVNYNNTQHGPQTYPIRLIISRDPVSRMISSYLDKMYLPDFWVYTGVRFMSLSRKLYSSQGNVKYQFDRSSISGYQNRLLLLNHYINSHNLSKTGHITMANSSNWTLPECDFLRKHFDDMSKLFNSSNPSEKGLSTFFQTRCGKYLTFTDFVTNTMSDSNTHWTPISKLCNPCKFQSTHISRMETFTEDARVILSKMGLDHLLENFDRVAQTDEELRMITDYHFTKVFGPKGSKFFSKCLTARELAFRLWNTFQWQGYIHPLVQYTIPTFTDVDQVKVDFLSQILKAREAGLRDPEAMKKAKHDFARKMVSSLPRIVLEKLMDKFSSDYSMFEYKRVNREECDIVA